MWALPCHRRQLGFAGPQRVETLLDRPLGDYETQRLRRVVATERPSAIIRLLHRWNGRITDRVARSLAPRSDISELVWG